MLIKIIVIKRYTVSRRIPAYFWAVPKAIMKNNVFQEDYSPTILVVKNDQAELASDSPILASFNKFHIPLVPATEILSWVQQHQPDLIILDIEWSEIVKSELIAVLRLDWLTRNIPILVITNFSANQLKPRANVDCDACLMRPYSAIELEQAICSLLSGVNVCLPFKEEQTRSRFS